MIKLCTITVPTVVKTVTLSKAKSQKKAHVIIPRGAQPGDHYTVTLQAQGGAQPVQGPGGETHIQIGPKGIDIIIGGKHTTHIAYIIMPFNTCRSH